jgi:hypothetical protein
MVVDDDFLEFEVRRLDELMVLVSNIEVKELDRLAPESTPAPAPTPTPTPAPAT